MKSTLKYICSVILFLGMLFSCFQYSIIQISKFKKETLSGFNSEEDIMNDNDDGPEKETELLKKDIEDSYITSTFDYSFFVFQKAKSVFNEIKKAKLKYPDLSLRTPPPKS